MAKLETVAQFIELVKSGKYEGRVNALRGAGRTRLSEGDKQKAYAFIDTYFGTGNTAKPGKKGVKKKAVAKAAAKPAPTPVQAAVKKAKKKRAAVAKSDKPVAVKAKKATLDISPTQVQSVSDILQIVDRTVSQSVSIIDALKIANELNQSGDISAGVDEVKRALIGAATALNRQVVLPLYNAQGSKDHDEVVTQKLAEVVAAAEQSPIPLRTEEHNNVAPPNYAYPIPTAIPPQPQE